MVIRVHAVGYAHKQLDVIAATELMDPAQQPASN